MHALDHSLTPLPIVAGEVSSSNGTIFRSLESDEWFRSVTPPIDLDDDWVLAIQTVTVAGGIEKGEEDVFHHTDTLGT